MAALDRGLRRELGRAVQKARKIAESGARAALGALMVGEGEADASLKVSDRALRRRLRAHGRQLGDAREDSGRQEVTRLAHEVAYEHWHRMLFARFLAENGLLIEPDSGVAVSLEDCRELARAQKMDPWALAGGFAAAMLPEIFRPDDPSLAIALPPETRRSLEKTLADLPPPVFHAGDALGWTYQYWQTDRKEEVNRSGVRIGAEELPAVTQLFTEPYMVRFLFHNTVGAWRAGRLLAERPELAETAENEDELRRAVRLESEGGYDFDFLRFVREGPDDGDGAAGRWCPAAGSYDRWPNQAAELRVLDPCCGSGHFLVEGLHLFVRLRMEEENLPIEDAVRAVLRDNLHGLEIDPRCSQIAAFSVAFAAWKLVGRVIDLLPLRLACSGFAPNATKDEWIALADRAAGAAGSAPQKGLFSKRDTIISADLRNTFEALHDMFVQAPTVGSLIDPHLAGASMYAAKFDAACPLLDAVLSAEEPDPEQRERAVAAAGMAEAASILAETYSLVITNVPYLGRGRQNSTLRELGDSRFGISRRNLATMFMERGFSWTKAGGTEALVVPEQCLFLKRYRGLRKVLLNQRQWRVVVWLGEHAFEDPSASGAFGAMTIVSRDAPDVTWEMAGVDVSAPHGERSIHTHEKAHRLRDETVRIISQRRQLRNPNSAILIEPMDTGRLLSEFAESFQGIGTKDYHRFGRCFWEFAALSESWRFQQSTARRSARFAGLEHVLLWEKGRGELDRLRRGGTLVVITGLSAWNRRGIAVSPTGNIRATAYLGEPFDDNTGVIVPKNESHYASIVSFCTSQLYSREVRRLDPSLKVTYPTLVNIPFNLDHWKAVAAEEFPNGLPEPYSDDPTQWIFHGHPCSSVVWDEDERRTAGGPVRTDTTVLQVAVARLLGYRWPAERDSEMCLADEQRNCVDRCANLHELADEDGIVCLPAVRGEASAADRLRGLLVAAYGREWAGAIEYRLLRATVGGGGGGGGQPRRLAAPGFLQGALRPLPPPPVHLAHLGWAPQRLPRARQLPPAGRPRR